jgi:hypothetical protein
MPSQNVTQRYERMKGYRVDEIVFEKLGTEEYPALVLTKPGQRDLVVVVYSDPECNGPGHLRIEEVPA